MGENAGVSNPYAPPEDRPRTPDGAPTDAPRAHDGPSWPPPMPRPPVPVAPERQPPDPEGSARALGLTRLFGVLILGSVLVATLPLPWQAAAFLFAVPAVVVGIRALVVAVRARTRGLVPLLATGGVVALLWTLFLATLVIQWPAVLERQECLEGALTVTATSACETQYQEHVDRIGDSLRERSTGS